MKKAISLVLAAALCAGVLAGCGQNNSPVDPGEQEHPLPGDDTVAVDGGNGSQISQPAGSPA